MMHSSPGSLFVCVSALFVYDVCDFNMIDVNLMTFVWSSCGSSKITSLLYLLEEEKKFDNNDKSHDIGSGGQSLSFNP